MQLDSHATNRSHRVTLAFSICISRWRRWRARRAAVQPFAASMEGQSGQVSVICDGSWHTTAAVATAVMSVAAGAVARPGTRGIAALGVRGAVDGADGPASGPASRSVCRCFGWCSTGWHLDQSRQR